MIKTIIIVVLVAIICFLVWVLWLCCKGYKQVMTDLSVIYSEYDRRKVQ